MIFLLISLALIVVLVFVFSNRRKAECRHQSLSNEFRKPKSVTSELGESKPVNQKVGTSMDSYDKAFELVTQKIELPPGSSEILKRNARDLLNLGRREAGKKLEPFWPEEARWDEGKSVLVNRNEAAKPRNFAGLFCSELGRVKRWLVRESDLQSMYKNEISLKRRPYVVIKSVPGEVDAYCDRCNSSVFVPDMKPGSLSPCLNTGCPCFLESRDAKEMKK